MFTEQQLNTINDLVAHTTTAGTEFTPKQMDEIKSLIANANTSATFSDQQISQIKKFVTDTTKVQQEYNAKQSNKYDKRLQIERMFGKGSPSGGHKDMTSKSSAKSASTSSSLGCNVASDKTVRATAARIYEQSDEDSLDQDDLLEELRRLQGLGKRAVHKT